MIGHSNNRFNQGFVVLEKPYSKDQILSVSMQTGGYFNDSEKMFFVF
jgi:hypothetical protein